MSPAEKKALKSLCGKRGKPELKRLFALIRAHDDRALLAAIAPKRTRKAATDTLPRDLSKTFAPLVAPAAEKAELLVEHLVKKHRRKLKLAPKGLADAARALRLHFTDAQIRAGAESLIKDLTKQYDARETVV